MKNQSFSLVILDFKNFVSKINPALSIDYNEFFTSCFVSKDFGNGLHISKKYALMPNYLKSEVEAVAGRGRSVFNVERKNLFIERIIDTAYGFDLIVLLFVLVVILLVLSVYFLFAISKDLKKSIRINSELRSSKFLVERALKIKEVLLGEVHHRVKNNLQMVISLLNIQARRDKKISVEDFMEKAGGRIEVFALIHGSLSDRKNDGKIGLQEYLSVLVENILDVLDRKQVVVNLNAATIVLDIQIATSLGLIINELVCNSIKHAFLDEIDGKIVITIEKTAEFDYKLFYADNGKGIHSVTKSTRSLGLDLVRMLALQIDGAVEQQNTPSLTYKIMFKDVPQM